MFSASKQEPKIKKAELQLTDIADAVQDDWVALARQLGLSDSEIVTISTDYTYSSEQALVMLHLWVDRFGTEATGNELQRALRRIGRQDVTTTCMSSVRVVTDEREWKVAQQQLDEDLKGFLHPHHPKPTTSVTVTSSLFVADTPHDDGSLAAVGSVDTSLTHDASLDVVIDEQDFIKVSNLTFTLKGHPHCSEYANCESRRESQNFYI